MSLHVKPFDDILGSGPLEIFFCIENRVRAFIREFSSGRALTSASSASWASGVSGFFSFETVRTFQFEYSTGELSEKVFVTIWGSSDYEK